MFNKFSGGGRGGGGEGGGGGDGPKGTMRLLLLDTFVWLHSPTSTLMYKIAMHNGNKDNSKPP